jgi:hypothetical protein
LFWGRTNFDRLWTAGAAKINPNQTKALITLRGAEGPDALQVQKVLEDKDDENASLAL